MSNMTIQTKFSPGDQVWVMHNNQAKKVEITQITIYAKLNIITANYSLYGANNGYNADLFPYGREEKYLFSTREELLETI